MQKNIYISSFPQTRPASQNALTFGVYAKNTSILLKKTPKYKKIYRNLCTEYACDGALETEIMQDIALFYAEKDLVMQAKTTKVKENMFQLLSDPNLPCYATGGQAPAFQNAAAHQIYNLLTAANDKAEAALRNNQTLLDEIESEYATAIVQKGQLEKEMAIMRSILIKD